MDATSGHPEVFVWDFPFVRQELKKNFIPFRDESQQVGQRSVFKVPSIPLYASAGGKATMCCGVQTFSLRLHSGEKCFSLYRQDLLLVPVKVLRNILRHFGESS